MKTFYSLLCLLVVSFTATAAWGSSPMESSAVKPYTFKFKMSQESFESTQNSSSYEEAFERAAKACFNHFVAQAPKGQKLSEDRGLDIIDVCANPRS